MPVKREAVTSVETGEQRLVRLELEDMLERAGAGPRALERERARVLSLIELDRPLEPDEQAEFERYANRSARRRRQAKRFAVAVDRRQRKHPDETRGDSALAVALAASEKRRVRDYERRERQAAAARAFEQTRAGATNLDAPSLDSAPRAPYQTPSLDEVTAPPTAAPRRPRVKVGIVAQYDAQGRRVL